MSASPAPRPNYAGRIGDRWMELVPVTLPNGDETPGFKRVVFGTIDEGFDPKTWEHREEFLRLVQEGRGQRRLWSTAVSGPTAARLDVAVADQFGTRRGPGQGNPPTNGEGWSDRPRHAEGQ